MATFDLGRVTPLYKGDYSASASYELNDVVLYNGNLYWHVQATATVGILPTDTTVWKLAFADEGVRAEIRGYADDAQVSKTAAAQSASQASASASQASASASQAALSAQTAGTKASEASASAQTASSKASEASTSAQSAATSAQTATDEATLASQKAAAASESASLATAKANAAATSETNAATSAQTATAKASEAAASATSAQEYDESAQQSAVNAQTAQGLAETAQTAAETAQGLAEDARDDAQSIVDEIGAKAEQIDANTASIVTLEQDCYKPYAVDTASGAVASFADGADGIPLKSLVVDINPVQSGSGDPSPDNVRPISGWTGANVAACGKNVFGGNALKESVLANIPNSTSGTDANGDYVSFSASNANSKKLFTAFKPNTRYTLIIRLANGATTSSTNISVKYTDDTYTTLARIDTSANTPETVVFTTPAGKSIKSIGGIWQSGTTYLYYNQCGVFEGVLTADDFEPYTGQTIPISWQTEAGTVYGGSLDVLSGVLTVDRAMVDLGTLTWNYIESQTFNFRASQLIGAKAPANAAVTPNAICSILPVLDYTTISTLVDGITIIFATSEQAGKVWAHSGIYTDATAFKAAMTGQTLVYELAEPQTYQLTPHEVKSLLGQNNIFADTGDTEVEYRADMKLYIERLTEPDADMIADANITSGSYFMVGNSLYLATANIASGGQVIVGTNCTRKSLATALNEINQ